MNSGKNKNEKPRQIVRANKMCLIFYIIAPIITAVGMVVAAVFKNSWYWIALAALLVCTAAFGINIGEIADEYAQPRYPQCYDKKGRVKTGMLKRLAADADDMLTLQLKRRQTSVVAAGAACVSALCILALLVI